LKNILPYKFIKYKFSKLNGMIQTNRIKSKGQIPLYFEHI
jgi:hypothetical protein